MHSSPFVAGRNPIRPIRLRATVPIWSHPYRALPQTYGLEPCTSALGLAA